MNQGKERDKNIEASEIEEIVSDLIGIRDVASLLQLNPATVLKMVLSGELTGIKMGKQYKFSRTYLLKYLKEGLGLENGKEHLSHKTNKDDDGKNGDY